MMSHRETIEATFPGLNIIGDEHFHAASKYFKEAGIIAPVSRQTGKLVECASLRNPRTRKRMLSPEEEERNAVIRSIRAPVEQPFGEVKRIFAGLSGKFRGTQEQHDYLVRTAFAMHNLRLARNGPKR